MTHNKYGLCAIDTNNQNIEIMKKLLLLLLLIITSESFIAQSQLTYKSRREIFLKSQLSSGGVRSGSPYSVTGIKEETWQYVILEFISSDDHLVIIEQYGNQLYSQSITLSQNDGVKKINIPLTSFDKGKYTMTVIDLVSGESTFGDFSIQ